MSASIRTAWPEMIVCRHRPSPAPFRPFAPPRAHFTETKYFACLFLCSQANTHYHYH